MTLLRGDADEVLAQLDYGQFLQCSNPDCGETFEAHQLDELEVYDAVECDRCHCQGFIPWRVQQREKPDKRIGARWGERVAACGWTALPNLLYVHQRELGLTHREVVFLGQLETFRRDSDEAVWPSYPTLAVRMGTSRRTIERWVSALVERGLLEVKERRRPDGTRTTNLITRRGLTRRLEALAKSTGTGKAWRTASHATNLSLAMRHPCRDKNKKHLEQDASEEAEARPRTHMTTTRRTD